MFFKTRIFQPTDNIFKMVPARKEIIDIFHIHIFFLYL